MSVTKDSLAGKSISEIRELSETLCGMVQQAAMEGQALYETEKAVLQTVLQIGRQAIDAVLALQGIGDLGASVTTAEGTTLKRSEDPQERRLRTVFGTHSFGQYTYSRGSNRAIELRPIDARLSLSPRVGSYLLEEFTQLFCIESAFGEAARNFETVFNQKIPVDTLESISRSMGNSAGTYVDHLPTPPAAEEGEILVATMDAKGVPLITTTPSPVKAFEIRRLRPGNRRMSTLAGVYSVDPHVRTADEIVAALFRDEMHGDQPARPKPMFKHLSAHFPELYGDGDEAVISTGAIEACCWLANQIDRRRKQAQPLLMLIDGDHRLWNTSADHLPDDTVEILDILHVATYVWEAADVLTSNSRDREAFTRSRLRTILEGGVKSVVRGLRHMATARALGGVAREKISSITNYFEAHQERMRYDEYLAKGYPIATGVIEGACRHLVKDRMERSGMRWTLEGAKAMLNVRSIHESDCWDHFHADRRQKEHQRFHPNQQLIHGYKPLHLAC